MISKQKSRSGIFLIELSVVIAIFAICAAIALKVVSVAGEELHYSENLTEAKHISAFIAESYKSGCSPENITDIGVYENGAISVETKNGTLIASLTERSGENGISYLDIKISDEDRTYLSITCARRNGNGQ